MCLTPVLRLLCLSLLPSACNLEGSRDSLSVSASKKGEESGVKRGQFATNQIMYSLGILCSLLSVPSLTGSGFELQKEKTNFPEERKRSIARPSAVRRDGRRRGDFSLLYSPPTSERPAKDQRKRTLFLLMTQVNQFPVEFANISLSSCSRRETK